MHKKSIKDYLTQSGEKSSILFDKSPIGILLFYKKAKLIDINESAVQIMGIPKLEEIKGINLFDEFNIGYIKDELYEKGSIKLQFPLNFDNIKNLGIYKPKRSGIAFFDLSIFVIDSGFLMHIQDVTEKKNTENELKIKERQLKLSLEAGLAGMWTRGQVGDWKATTGLNPLFGRSINDPPLLEDEFSDYIHPEDLPRLEKAWRSAKDGKSDYDQEYRVIWPDGSIHWLASKGKIVLENNMPHFMGITYDITKRKNTEETLKKSEEWFKSVVDTSPSLLVIFNAERKVIYVSSNAVEMTGYTPEEISQNIWIVHPDDKPRLQELFENAFTTSEGTRGIEYRSIKKNGDIWWTATTSKPLIDEKGKFNGFVVQLFDITEQKKIEEELIKTRDNLEEQVEERTIELKKAYNSLKKSEYISNERLREIEAIYDSAPIGLCVFDTELRYKRINKRLAEINGIPAEEHIGKTVREVFPDLAEQFETIAQKILDTFKPVYDFEITGTTPAMPDNLRTMIEQWIPLKDHKGKIVGINVAVMEITEIKKSEKERENLINELKRSNDELKRFAYVSSHDLQEPLRTIASFTQLLEHRYKGQLDNDADEFLDYIVDASIRMKEQIQGLLEYSRVATETEDFGIVDMNLILNQTIHSISILIEESKAEIIIEELPNVMGNATLLQRVFQNLISNAIRFRKCEEPLKIYISSYESEDRKEYVFSIKDNGIGIEEQYFERIFTIFQRLHTRDVYKGTGIGLSIVKRIIERHGGRIWVESEFGVGSTFYFTVPVNNQ